MTTEPDLLTRWRAALPPGVDGAAADDAGTDLLRRWAEPHRRYHDVAHLAAVLSIVDAHAGTAADADAVRLAAWFHDAVYDPQADDNEERSAQLAVATLTGLGMAPQRVGEVARLVRLTAAHSVPPDDSNGALLADADLAVLAAPPAGYDRYAAAVRQEYAHVPDPLFRAGRAAVLRHLMGLPQLYRIVPDRAERTRRAHDNLRRELDGLARAGS
ncbi:MAG TPA: metal-dependent phosphohydrolase [Micromonosporaceae bacterium]|nr:metal-dependent phosphohydrolase [Micromonosporaceae bacterium]